MTTPYHFSSRFNSGTLRVGTFLLLILIINNCKKKDDPEPEPTEQEKVTMLLTAGTGVWTPQAASGVVLAGIDVSEDLFKDFSIKFTANQIVTTGTTPVWLRQDTWQFKAGSSTIIIRGQDNKEVTIDNITETELKLSLDWDRTTYDDGGKIKSLPGKYEFVMNK